MQKGHTVKFGKIVILIPLHSGDNQRLNKAKNKNQDFHRDMAKIVW